MRRRDDEESPLSNLGKELLNRAGGRGADFDALL
jgi:hypothetical protein